MSPDFVEKWNHILETVEKNKIPIQFIKKLVLKLDGKRQQTINVERLLAQGLDMEELEQTVSKKISAVEDDISSIEFVLDIKAISDTIQPTTDELLKNL
jgi:hypothetical protein